MMPKVQQNSRTVNNPESKSHLPPMYFFFRQSQPASATLRNIFEKDLLRRQEIEFFSWPGIDFHPYFGNSPIR